MEVEVLGGVGWSTPYPGCFTSRTELVPCVENGGSALKFIRCLQKITSSLGFELQTIQRIVNHCASYIITPHQEHNDLNVNDKISDFHGVHILFSYTIW